MQYGDIYTHFNQKHYRFIGIALPRTLTTIPLSECQLAYDAFDAHTPKGEVLKRDLVFEHKGILLTDKPVPHVIYQALYDNQEVWMREVDEFFGYKLQENGEWVRRFTNRRIECTNPIVPEDDIDGISPFFTKGVTYPLQLVNVETPQETLMVFITEDDEGTIQVLDFFEKTVPMSFIKNQFHMCPTNN